MSLLFTALTSLSLVCTASAQTNPRQPEQQLLTRKDLAGKSLQDLWLMRNEIYAKHGKPFTTAELNAYFQSKRFEPDIEYSDSRLTETDKKNAALILSIENELLKRNYIQDGPSQRVNYENVINRFQFGEFSEKEKELLSKNGFLFTPSKYRQLFHIYEENDYAGIGSLITVDTVLHLYHLFFDFSLRAVEEQALLPRLNKLTGSLLNNTKHLHLHATSPEVGDAAGRNIAFLSVALGLGLSDKIGEDAVKSVEWLPESLKATVITEIARCNEHIRPEPSALRSYGTEERFPKLDYTQFTPRGHYTRSESLTRFFKAMMWYGQFSFSPKSDKELLQAVLLTYALYSPWNGDSNLIGLWDELYEPTALFVGTSDDIGPKEIKAAMDETCRNCVPNTFSQKGALEKLRASLKKLAAGKSRIGLKPVSEDDYDKFELRFMGQRFVPDSDILQRLTKPINRPMPMGLDIMAVLGSRAAEDLMLTKYSETWKDWPEYPRTQADLIREYRQLKSEDWKQNFYWRWLWGLKALLEQKPDKSLPFFMRTPAYQYRSLLTASASWAQLRHDTILYAKESGSAECGGGSDELQKWVPDPPKGYVEPNLEFYRRLKETIDYTAEHLERLQVSIGYDCPQIPGRENNCPKAGESVLAFLWKRFGESVSLLESIASKELRGIPLSNSDYEQIRTFGSLLEHMTLTLMKAQLNLPRYDGWESIDAADREIPTIADVHSVHGSDLVLQAGVGYASALYGIVEIDGRLKLLRGAALSYHEFTQPLSGRLTDELWQEMLATDAAPPAPEWTDTIFTGQPHIMPNPVYVLDPEIRDSSKQGNRGWQRLIYETGS